MRFSFGGGVGRSAFGASARPRAPVKGTVKGCKGSKTKATKKAKKVRAAAAAAALSTVPRTSSRW